ncbi:MAG: NAD(P)/FAD-dependent oxidoreductase [Actinomycetes bacterium]
MSPNGDRPTEVLVVGGGYVGLYTALRLQRRLCHGEARVTVVEPRSYMTYQPFLPEAAAGSVEPRHVVVPLRRVLTGCHVLSGRVTEVAHTSRTATVELLDGERRELSYDVLVMAPGSVARTLPIPGLAESGIGFKTVEEAIYLRNHVLSRLALASSSQDPAERRRALTFVFVGGGYAGVEALAELEDMARYACRYYEAIEPEDMRWILVEATGRILPEVGEDMGRYTVDELRRRGMDVRLDCKITSAVGLHVVLESGEEFDVDTLVWTAGVKPHPVLAATDLPLDEKGRLVATAELQVDGVPDAWTAGDCAAVPDLTKGPGQFCGPSAQHAVRQARRLADNIVASLRGERLAPYRHKYAGSVASLGLHKGVAQVYGVKLRGWPAWFMHRTYHVSRVPTLNRKARVVADWTLALFFRREVVTLGSLEKPRREFEMAAAPPPQRPWDTAS